MGCCHINCRPARRPRASAGTGGAGLGLAIAKGIVQAHGGSMELDPSTPPDQGTCFSVRLPAEAEVLEGATR